MTDNEYIQKLKAEIHELRSTMYHEGVVRSLLNRIYQLEKQLDELKEKYNEV